MYAIIKTGGKQYRVTKGDVIDVELLENATEIGAEVRFGEVLFATDGSKTHLGAPHIDQFFVHGEIVDVVAGEKVTGFKYKPNHTVKRKWGHRQKYSRVKITEIGHVKEGKHGN